MSTPHNSAEKGDIAKVVLMPGDPLRAKVVADRYLTDVTCFNKVRNMYGFTGTYQGKRISIMGSGMGMPSMGIYSYELYNFYDVDSIIRIGTAGGISTDVHVRDVVIGQAACTDSNFAYQFGLPGSFAPVGDFGMLRQAADAAEALGAPYHVGNIFSTDVFYNASDHTAALGEMGVLATEMECAALYLTATKAHKKALGIMTISDHLVTGESLSAEDRQNTFTQMMEIALCVAVAQA